MTVRSGKYAGSTYESVAINDQSYCEWVLRDVEPGPGGLGPFSAYLRQRANDREKEMTQRIATRYRIRELEEKVKELTYLLSESQKQVRELTREVPRKDEELLDFRMPYDPPHYNSKLMNESPLNFVEEI